jgi:hypothetical protein
VPKTSGRRKKSKFSFRAFLSHRYKSPEINLHFFDLFSKVAEVQFEVDEGASTMNMTRVERMIRDADAFIGIYPYPGTSKDSAQQLQQASRYFRLELDLAIRSGKPAIIFYDELYGTLFKCPDSVTVRDFDAREILSKGGSPKSELYRSVFETFCATVRASMSYQVASSGKPRRAVGLALPARGGKIYGKVTKAILATLTKELGQIDHSVFSYPPVLDRNSFNQLDEVDWMLIDIGPEMAATGLPAYLHGQFVPCMRLKYSRRGAADIGTSALEKTLYGGIDVGYVEDILAWKDQRELIKGLRQRLRAIKVQQELISTADEATAYFEKAAKRKERIFFSYAGANREAGAQLSSILKKRFQKVFDYRDGVSIEPGEPWLDEIFDQLSTSPVGICLLSKGYVASKNCLHEAREMTAKLDSGKMKVIPVSLAGEKYNMQSWLSSTQALNWSEEMTADMVVNQIIEILDRKKKRGSKGGSS